MDIVGTGHLISNAMVLADAADAGKSVAGMIWDFAKPLLAVVVAVMVGVGGTRKGHESVGHIAKLIAAGVIAGGFIWVVADAIGKALQNGFSPPVA